MGTPNLAKNMEIADENTELSNRLNY